MTAYECVHMSSIPRPRGHRLRLAGVEFTLCCSCHMLLAGRVAQQGADCGHGITAGGAI